VDIKRRNSLKTGKRVSVVVPVFNELENIRHSRDEILAVFDEFMLDGEIIFVDDGSTDGTVELLREISNSSSVKSVLLRRNYGQTAAMHAGIQSASGRYITTIDGDLQNDPRDIPKMLELLDSGYDMVFGWRHDRQDKFLSRKLPSLMANKLISKVTGFPIHDLGCTLKSMRAEIAKDLELYGEMHRFIPILASNLGARCTELKVNHRARQFGESKYGIGRWIRVILDLITIQYMTKYFSSPMKLFGFIGFIMGVCSIVFLMVTAIMKMGWGADVTGNPTTYIAIFSGVIAVQFFSLGLLGELAVRIYYSVGDRKNYHIRELVNFNQPAQSTSEQAVEPRKQERVRDVESTVSA